MAFRQQGVIALIPARGGSKGVDRKNMRVVRGKPLIAHTVGAALAAEAVDRVCVSSDDPQILSYAASIGAEAVDRPAAAASDTATASDVVAAFVAQLPEAAETDPYIVYLQPTSPFRTGVHIDAAFAALAARDAALGMSVVAPARNPYKSFVLDDQGLLRPLFSEDLSSANRQDLPRVYQPNGAIYIFRVSEYLKRGRFPSEGGVPFVMSEKDSLDIDTEDDIALAERI